LYNLSSCQTIIIINTILLLKQCVKLFISTPSTYALILTNKFLKFKFKFILQVDAQVFKKTKRMNEPVFIVEKILDKRKIKDKIEYLLKWKNYSNEHNSWEPLDNLDCPDLIKKFEETRPTDTDSNNANSGFYNNPSHYRINNDLENSNVSSVLIAERILAEQPNENNKKERMYLIEWKNSNIPSLVSKKWFKNQYPHLVKEYKKTKEEEYMDIENENMETANNKLIPIKILGAKPDEKNNNEIYFLIRWTNSIPSLVSSQWFRNKYPQIVIKFYETKLRFIDKDENVKDKKDNDLHSLEEDNESENYNGLIPEKVLGAKPVDNNNDKLQFLVKWKNTNQCSMIASRFAYSRFPQIVIDFYENNIEWYE
jgi:hypothetical protein